MAVINFTITDTLDKKIKKVVKEKGFQSKAEFFRTAVFQYISGIDQSENVKKKTNDREFSYLEEKLAQLLIKKYAGKKIPSLEEQLKSI